MNAENRIESLEVQVRTLNAALAKQSKTFKRMLYGFGCLLVAGVTLAATSMGGIPEVLQAKAFEVVNNDGSPAAFLSANSRGEFLHIRNKHRVTTTELFSDGRLRLYMTDGTEAVDLYAYLWGSQLELNNNDEQAVAALNAIEFGGTLLITKNEPDGPR